MLRQRSDKKKKKTKNATIGERNEWEWRKKKKQNERKADLNDCNAYANISLSLFYLLNISNILCVCILSPINIRQKIFSQIDYKWWFLFFFGQNRNAISSWRTKQWDSAKKKCNEIQSKFINGIIIAILSKNCSTRCLTCEEVENLKIFVDNLMTNYRRK